MTSTSGQIGSAPFRCADHGGVQVVSLSGYMGNDECEHVAGELAWLLKEGHTRIILDCSTLTFITSAGLTRLFVKAQSFRRHQGILQLAGLRAFKRKLAEAVGFDPRTELQAQLDSALEALPRSHTCKSKKRSGN